MRNDRREKISFLIPCLNEEECIPALLERIRNVAARVDMDAEILFVDDGSTDNTLAVLRKLREDDLRIRIISFSRNFGHQLAVKAGLGYVSGDCTVVMDCDLQDPPDLVPEMIARWRVGVKVVYALRRNRQENFLKRLCYASFYYLLNRLSPVHIPRDAGDFCLMDRQVVGEINRIVEYKPFVRGLRAWVGFRQEGLEYDRPARYAGRSSYSYSHLFKLALDGFMSCTDVFLVWASVIGVVISACSLLYGTWIGVSRMLIAFGLWPADSLVPGWATIVCLMSFLIGLQFIYLGLLGKYVGRIFMHTKDRPLYIVSEAIGFRDE